MRTILSAVLALGLSADTPQAARPSPFTVAVVDAGGRLLPVARFDGRRWRNTWTRQLERHEALPASRTTDIPVRWLGRQVPLEWTMFDDGGWRTIRTTGVGRWDRCISPVVLETTAGAPVGGAGMFRIAFDAAPAFEAAPSIADATMSRVHEGLPGFFTAADAGGLRPLGILRVRGRSVWVIEIPSGGSAVVLIVDISRTGIRQLALADAGGC